MKVTGAGDNYLLSFRHLTLKANQTIVIKATGEYYYFVGGFSDEIKIISDTGAYDLLNVKLTEMQHEHTGKITIENKNAALLHLEFIVVIPQLIKKEKI
jgi:hypothetical protein